LHRIKHQPKSTIIEQHKKHQVGINHSSTVNQESHFEMFTAAPSVRADVAVLTASLNPGPQKQATA